MGFMDRIAKLWSRDKVVKTTEKGRGYTLDDPSGMSGGMVSASQEGLRSLIASLSMDQSLLNRYADYENMDDYPELQCLAGDSLVFVLHEGWVSIRDLSERGGSFYVLSYDKHLKSIVPAEATCAKKTGDSGHKKKMVRVVLDNGTSIRCTHDHLFLCKDGKWVEAGKLVCGHRLMPAAVRMRNLGGSDEQYWQVHQPHPDSDIRSSDNKRWVWLHMLVGERLLGARKGDVVHHLGGKTLDNSPENLSIEDASTHAFHHIAGLNNSLKYDLLDRDANHRVLSVEWLEHTEDVYDVCVPGYVNFSCNGVIVHNSALDIYADDSTIPDSVRGKSIWGMSRDKIVRDLIDDCMHRRLRIEEDMWLTVRTVCKYGNAFAEIVVTDVGVVALNFLPVPTVRRLVNNKGDLVGYVQDLSGQFSLESGDYQNIEKLKDRFKERGMIFFEPWEIVHWRLRSKYMNSLYGYSILDAARWIWKRLSMLEDTALVYKLCLRGDSQVWTTSGRKAIRDLEEGEEVYSYATSDTLKKTRVVYKKHNGKDLLYRIRSLHRELYANATHPVLVEIIDGQGKGKSRVRRMEYVEVKDLHPGVHRLVTPFKDNSVSEDISFVLPVVGRKARLSSRAIEDGVKIEAGIKNLQDDCGMQTNLIKEFFAGEYEVAEHTAEKVLRCNGTPLEYLDTRPDWGGVKRLGLPDVVDEDFARWFGFMIGDGFASERPFTNKNGVKCFVRDVGFAAGDKEDINQKYKDLFEKFFGEVKFHRDKRYTNDCVGKYSVSSKALYEFMLLNGFVPGSNNTRVPEWVFRARVPIRQAFLDGIADADGHIHYGSVSEEMGRVRHRRVIMELCNEDLVNDIRELAMQIGYRVTSVTSRLRNGDREILGNGFPLKYRVYYSVAWSVDSQPMTEMLHSVEQVEVDDIWDIGVEADEHNFVANGIVVHNTRSPSRYAFYVDTGDLPPDEAVALVKKVKQGYKKRTLINPTTGQLDFRNNPLCLTGDTKVPLLDGRVLSVVDIVSEYERGRELWVHSVRPGDRKLHPMPLSWAGRTRRNAELVKITLDNGEEVRCTPDHKFPLSDGSKIAAEELETGMSMMPFRRGEEKIVRIDSLSGKLHVVSVEYLSEREDTYTLTVNGTHTFALDAGIFTFNSPEDDMWIPTRGGKESTRVEVMSGPDWQCLTGDTPIPLLDGTVRTIGDLAESGDDVWLYAMNERGEVVPGRGYSARKTKEAEVWEVELDNGEVVKCSDNHPFMLLDGAWLRADQLVPGVSLMPLYTETSSFADGDFLDGYEKVFDPASEKFVYTHQMVNRSRTGDLLPQKGNVIHHAGRDRLDNRPEALVEMSRSAHSKLHLELSGHLHYDEVKAAAKGRDVASLNHRVVSVRNTGETEWLYDLTVDEYHNFAVGQGVFVHNSMEDIEYFRDKMFTAIKIPRSHFGGDAEADSGLAQKDVRFARTCMRIQREFKNGMRQVLRVHMAALGIDPDTIDWELRMTVPSSIFELQQIEVLNSQAGLMSTLSEWFDDSWLLRHVLNFSGDDAAKIVSDNEAEHERKLNNEARIESTLKKRYPEVDIDAADSPPPAQEDIDVQEKLDKLVESVKETRQTSGRVLKRMEELKPVRRVLKRLSGGK